MLMVVEVERSRWSHDAFGTTRRGRSVGLAVEGRKSCITAFWGELRSRGMVPLPDIGKVWEGRTGGGVSVVVLSIQIEVS